MLPIEVTPAYESERALVGALLRNSSLFDEIKNHLCPADFFCGSCVAILESMYRVYDKRGMFDMAMISDDSEKSIEYLRCMADSGCDILFLKTHIDIIREKSVAHQLNECIKDMPGLTMDYLNKAHLL